MDQDICVSVRNVGKTYRIFDKPQDRLMQALWRTKRYYREFTALRDINFDLKRGETLGIIGVNGSGKSTLLHIIAGTVAPTTGEVQVRGRVAALLELGSGFNPDFTGRENVYLNGNILGLSREEMTRHMPDILDFAEIGDFIDQPVKIYSSGMFLRLAFSVQTCIQPDIMIVDEALAVGDAAFVHKCINRIRHLAARGVPILFVTHDIDSVRSLCNRVIWLDKGGMRMTGEPKEVTSYYLREIFSLEKSRADEGSPDNGSAAEPAAADENANHWGSGEIKVLGVQLHNSADQNLDVFDWGETLKVMVTAQARQDVPSEYTSFGIAVRNRNGLDVIAVTTFDEGQRHESWKSGEIRKICFTIPNIMAPGDYSVCACVEDRASPVIKYYDYFENAVIFKSLANKPVWSVVLPQVECVVSMQNDLGVS